MTTVICPKCGTENSDSAMNCKECRINLKFALENLDEIEPIKQDETKLEHLEEHNIIIGKLSSSQGAKVLARKSWQIWVIFAACGGLYLSDVIIDTYLGDDIMYISYLSLAIAGGIVPNLLPGIRKTTNEIGVSSIIINFIYGVIVTLVISILVFFLRIIFFISSGGSGG